MVVHCSVEGGFCAISESIRRVLRVVGVDWGVFRGAGIVFRGFPCGSGDSSCLFRIYGVFCLFSFLVETIR